LKIKNSLQYLIVLYIYIFNQFLFFLIKKNAQKRSKHSLRYATNKPKTHIISCSSFIFFLKNFEATGDAASNKKSNPRIFVISILNFGETQKIKEFDAFKLIEKKI
jgi:hypothetical protein